MVPGQLVVCVEDRRATGSLRRVEEVTGHHLDGVSAPAEVRQVHAPKGRVVPHLLGGLSDGNPVDPLAGVHVVRGKPVVGWLPDRQPLDTGQAATRTGYPLRDGRARGLWVVRLIRVGTRCHEAAAATARGGHVQDARRRIQRRRIRDVQPSGAPNVIDHAGIVALEEPRHERSTDAVVADQVQRLLPQLGRPVDDVVVIEAEGLGRLRPGGKGLCRRSPVSRYLCLEYRHFFDRPYRLPGLPVEGVDDAGLRRLNQRRNGPPVHFEINENRDVREVVVPLVVVDRLEVPHALARLNVEGDHARAEEVGPGTEPAEIVDRRRIGGEVDEPEVFVRGHRRPRRDVPRPLPGVVQPCLVTDLARSRNHMELPLEGTAPGVESEDVARHVFDSGLEVPLLRRVPDHHHAVHDDGRRRGGDVAQLPRDAMVRIVRTAVGEPRPPIRDEGHQQVHDARRGEALVERGQAVERGMAIAQVGQTGTATAEHVHYEIWVGGRAMDPQDYILNGMIP